MFDALSVAAVKERRLTAGDYKTLGLATLGGLLEFYDFIIFVFFANTIGQLFFPPQHSGMAAAISDLRHFRGRLSGATARWHSNGACRRPARS